MLGRDLLPCVDYCISNRINPCRGHLAGVFCGCDIAGCRLIAAGCGIGSDRLIPGRDQCISHKIRPGDLPIHIYKRQRLSVFDCCGGNVGHIIAVQIPDDLRFGRTANIPKSIQDNGRTLTLQTIDWQTDNTATMDGYALGDRFTAVATYTGSATSSYVKGYTVTADYTGTVGKINLDRVRYVAIFEGTPLQPVEEAPAAAFNWAVILAPIAVVALVGAAAGAALVIRRRRESDDGGSEEQVQG